MVYVILVLGLLLVVMTFKRSWNVVAAEKERQLNSLVAKENSGSDTVPFSGESLEKMENRLEMVAQALVSLKERLELVEKKLVLGEKKEVFNTILEDSKRTVLYEDIYAAYDAGKDITTIAQELGKGKGEIELILQLRRSKNI